MQRLHEDRECENVDVDDIFKFQVIKSETPTAGCARFDNITVERSNDSEGETVSLALEGSLEDHSLGKIQMIVISATELKC